MEEPSDYMRGWIAGWTAAAKSMIEMQQHIVAMLPPKTMEMAGNKPTGRKRGRPRKTEIGAATAAPRRRGRPPKSG